MTVQLRPTACEANTVRKRILNLSVFIMCFLGCVWRLSVGICGEPLLLLLLLKTSVVVAAMMGCFSSSSFFFPRFCPFYFNFPLCRVLILYSMIFKLSISTLLFSTEYQQDDVFNECVKELIDSALEGRNATVLAYGQVSHCRFNQPPYCHRHVFSLFIPDFDVCLLSSRCALAEKQGDKKLRSGGRQTTNNSLLVKEIVVLVLVNFNKRQSDFKLWQRSALHVWCGNASKGQFKVQNNTNIQRLQLYSWRRVLI